MKEILFIIGGFVIIGIVVLLCFSLCYVAGKADEAWEESKREMEKKNERHRL